MDHPAYEDIDYEERKRQKEARKFHDLVLTVDRVRTLAINTVIVWTIFQTISHTRTFKQMTKAVSVLNRALLRQSRPKHAILSRLANNKGGAFSQLIVDKENGISILERSSAKRAKHTAFYSYRKCLTNSSQLVSVKLIGGKKVIERDGSFLSPWSILDKHTSQQRVRGATPPISIISSLTEYVRGK